VLETKNYDIQLTCQLERGFHGPDLQAYELHEECSRTDSEGSSGMRSGFAEEEEEEEEEGQEEATADTAETAFDDNQEPIQVVTFSRRRRGG